MKTNTRELEYSIYGFGKFMYDVKELYPYKGTYTFSNIRYPIEPEMQLLNEALVNEGFNVVFKIKRNSYELIATRPVTPLNKIKHLIQVSIEKVFKNYKTFRFYKRYFGIRIVIPKLIDIL